MILSPLVLPEAKTKNDLLKMIRKNYFSSEEKLYV